MELHKKLTVLDQIIFSLPLIFGAMVKHNVQHKSLNIYLAARSQNVYPDFYEVIDGPLIQIG